MNHTAYHHGMQRSAIVALVLLNLCGVALAQRGGGHAAGGGAARGFSSGAARPSFSGAQSAPAAFHSSYAARPTYAARPNTYAARPAYATPQRYAGTANPQVRRPALYNRRNSRGYYPSYGYGLGYPYGLGSIDSGFDSYDNNALYDNSGQTPDTSNIAQGPDSTYPDGVMPPPPPQRTRPQPIPAPEAAVTLIFKDGRAPLQIHNYALTRTTLYVTDAHHRDIPVADLDLAATQKANDDAGVTFTLPTPQ